MYNENEKSKMYRKANNNPVPVRFGGLKPLLQMHANEEDQSMNWLVKKIVRDYFEERGVKMEVVIDD